MQIGFYAAIPWICAAVGMILYGRHSDKTGERRNHIAFACFVGMLAFVASGKKPALVLFVRDETPVVPTVLEKVPVCVPNE